MLFPKNNDKTLSDALFRDPGCEYRGTPFWAWNCELEEKELLWQLETLKQMGFGGAHLHVRTGMETPYLSDEHMDLVKSCVKKCRQEDMKAWLYDEDRWPSGAAGGFVTKEKQYRAQHLLFTTEPYTDDKKPEMSYERHGELSRSNNGHLLACFDIVLDDTGCLRSGKRIDPEQPCEGTKWYAYVENPSETPWFNYQTYVDTLSKDAISRFVEISHERYWETVGKDFGGVIPAIFTDEPQFTHKKPLGFAKEQTDVILPWTADVPETFRAAYGEELVDNLPQLLWELPDGQVSAIRYHYHDHIAERFAEAFADTIGAWCEDHNLMLTGHLMLEGTLAMQNKALGETMRSYRSFQLPGIDMLYDRREFTTAKQAQSASHQYGREGVLSELYGVTGWDFDFRGHKFQGDWQAALGVTVRVPHLAWVSMKGEAKRDYPAAISYQSPWWKDYSYVEDHYARVCTAMTRGEADVRVAVIHPIESYWLHFGPAEQTEDVRKQLDENFLNITEWLLHGGIDFDFISESLLPEQCPQGGAPLQVGKMTYDTIVVPGCQTLRSTTLERLEAFASAGGRLIFLGDAPKYENAVPSTRGCDLWNKAQRCLFAKEAVLEVLEPVRTVDIRNSNGTRTDNLLHQLRQDGDDRWLFIAHGKISDNRDIPNRQDIRITLDGQYGVLKYDTLTGDIVPTASELVGGKTVVKTTLYDHDSLLLRYTDVNTVPQQPEKKSKGRTVQLPVGQKIDFELNEPNVYLMDKAEYALDDEPYAPAMELLRADDALRERMGWHKRQSAVAQPWVIEEKKPEHTVRLRFTVHCAQDIPGVKLALEDARLASITCNAQPVTAEPDGWFTDKSIATVPIGMLLEGVNTIEIAIPFGKRTNVEWCYLLGDFGVRICGEYRELTAAPVYLGFDDITRQGLAHYGGNVTYLLPIKTNGGDLTVTVPHYAGAAVRVELDARKDYVVYAPYQCAFKDLPAGEHMLRLTVLGHRHNCFGPVHLADPKDTPINPNAWRTTDSKWTESYRLKTIGILTAPILEETVL